MSGGPEAAPSADASGEKRMGFFDHLAELRTRLIWSAVALLVGFLLCYPFAHPLFDFLARPVHDALPAGGRLAYTRLTEPFFVYLKVAALAGIFVASPFVLLQVWLFIAPALYRNEKRYVVAFIGPATLCFLGGAAFAFELLFPSICRFFISQGEGLQMVVTVDTYFSMLFWTVLGVALTFELPVVIGVVARLGLVAPRTLLQRLDVALIACLVIAAAITPTPDAMTMLFVAVPMLLLYAISILIAWLVAPRGEDGASGSRSRS